MIIGAFLIQVDFEENGKIYNIGYNGINQEKGDTYNFYLFAKSEQTLHLTVSIQINNQTSCSSDIIINDANWKRYDAQFLATETARNATFSIQCQEKRNPLPWLLFSYAFRNISRSRTSQGSCRKA